MQKYFGVLGALLCLVILLTCMPQKTVNEEAKPSPQDGAEAALPGVTETAGERSAESDTTAGKGIRAVSLSVLQNRLQQSQPAAGTMKMAGLTSITGYVEDKSNQDLVLLGTTNASLPPLHTEDFVVALRYAFLKYAEFKDNTYYYSYPGCSIDPQPEVLAELQHVGDQILSSDYSALLDVSKILMIEQIEDASRRGWMVFKRISDVIEVTFPNLMDKPEA